MLGKKRLIYRILSIPVSLLLVYLVWALNIPNPMMILIIPVVFFSFSEGYLSGTMSGVVAVAYSLFFFLILTKDPSGVQKAATIILAVTAIIIMTGKLKAKDNKHVIEIVRTREKAEEANIAKSVFLANMSHEIRTQMNAILGITEIELQNGLLPADTIKSLDRILDSGSLMLSILNDILDISKIEAGKLELVPVEYSVTSLLNETIQINRIRYDCKPIDFQLVIDEGMPLNLFGDELRLKQILNNILSNAFKYTAKGTVRLSISHELVMNDETDSNRITLIMQVSDTGQGMTEDQIDKIFDEYTRFNTDVNRTTTGTGLGMSITKRLLDLMGGEIFIDSKPGNGSTFTIRVPHNRVGELVCGPDAGLTLINSINDTTKAKKRQVPCEAMPYGRVLIVDDVDLNIFVARGMLMPYGLNIDTASSGIEAIDKIKEGKVYDIVFMDHMMPQMNGIEAVKIMREMGYSNCIVALTANALAGQAETFLNNGFDGYISKPIDSTELSAILDKFVRNRKIG